MFLYLCVVQIFHISNKWSSWPLTVTTVVTVAMKSSLVLEFHSLEPKYP